MRRECITYTIYAGGGEEHQQNIVGSRLGNDIEKRKSERVRETSYERKVEGKSFVWRGRGE